jgi:peptide/histidine transporter 3/4
MTVLNKKITGNERGITVFQRIGIGMFLSVLCMVSAALVEKKRTHVASTHGLLDTPKTAIPLSIFWLIPQFVLLGIADVFTLVGLQEYFYDQVPDSMRSLGISFYLSVWELAVFSAVFSSP